MPRQRATQSVVAADELVEHTEAGIANRSLRIVRVEPFCLRNPRSSLALVIVRVVTEEGIVGFGEATGTAISPIMAWLGVFGGTLVGRSAWDRERLAMLQRDQYTHGSVTQAVLSALDIAYWDIAGKALNVPVHALLGGRLHDQVRIYHHPWRRGIESYSEATRQLVARGITAGKLDPFTHHGYNRELTSRDLEQAVRIVQDIRDGGGPDFTICVEMHGRFNVATAIRVMEAMAPLNPLFVEEPVPAENPESMAEVQRSTTVPVATGERVRSSAEYLPYLERRACRILQPDIGHMGGITGLKRLAHVADDYYITVAPHCCWGPVHSMAAAHVSSTIPNFLIQEDVQESYSDFYAEAVVGGYTFDPKQIAIPEAPGLGIHIPDTLIQEYQYDPEQADVDYQLTHAHQQETRNW